MWLWYENSFIFNFLILFGAIVGKEGPLVHVASIIEDQATKRIGIFNKLRRVCQPSCTLDFMLTRVEPRNDATNARSGMCNRSFC